MGRSSGWRRSDPHRRSDEADAAARSAGAPGNGTEQMNRFASVAVALLAWFAFAQATDAQMTGTPAAGYRREAGVSASTMPAPLREIGFDQNINQPIPLDAELTDESGRMVRLAQYFGQKPVVLAFVYYDCPMLCTQVLSALTSTLDVLSLDAGRDFEVVAVSFDPRETPVQAAARKATALERYHH